MFLGLVLSPWIAAAKNYLGVVTNVHDGDTVTIRISHSIDAAGEVYELKRQRSERVRLVEIDAPELDQPWGEESRRALYGLVQGKDVLLVNYGFDDFDRRLGRLYRDDLDVNATLVENGDAWVFAKYAEDLYIYELENQARIEGAGLWKLPWQERVPPWLWRRRTR